MTHSNNAGSVAAKQSCPYCKASLNGLGSVVRHMVNTVDPENPVHRPITGRYVQGAANPTFYAEEDFDFASGLYSGADDYDTCSACGMVQLKSVLPKKEETVLLHLRTEIVNEKPEREISLRASAVEFQPFNNEIEFYNMETEEHDHVLLEGEGGSMFFVYQGVTYDFCSVYPDSVNLSRGEAAAF